MARDNTAEINVRICSKCGKEYRGRPAISRVDNSTPICPVCGTREALESLGLGKDEIEKMIASIPNVNDK